MIQRAALPLLLVLMILICVVTPGVAATVGISWAGFRSERWRVDQAAMQSALERVGVDYIETDAENSSDKQILDILQLAAREVDALVVMPTNAKRLLPLVESISASGTPVISYDRLIDSPMVFHLTFDSLSVGRFQARALMQARPSGRYVFLNGPKWDPNSERIRRGQLEVLADALAAGDVVNVGESDIDDWSQETAYAAFEDWMAANEGEIDAVLAANDTIAEGVDSSLREWGFEGNVPITGQDGGKKALNRIARGTQLMTAWKDSRALGTRAGEIAAFLAQGGDVENLPDAIHYTSPSGNWEIHALFMAPRLITRANLDAALTTGWITREELCADADLNKTPVCKTE